MKKKHNQLVVSPCCVRHYYHEEAAPAGEAAVAVNLRQREHSLEVTGRPATLCRIVAGHRVVHVDGAHFFTEYDGFLYCDGSVVAHVPEGIIAMHRVGTGIVVVTRNRLRHLCYEGNACVEVNVAHAVPSISFVAADSITSQHEIDEYTFARGYTRWAPPLDTADVAGLRTAYRNAWNDAVASITAQGAYAVPLMVCYGVRMWDDNYLYFSNPETVGVDTLANVQWVSAQVMADGGRYTGVGPASLTMSGYRLGIKVATGVGQQWSRLVKAIDVFVTTRPRIVDAAAFAYRCLSSQGGARVLSVQYGWQPLSQDVVMASLEMSGWKLIATTTDLDALARGHFIAHNVVREDATATGVVVAPMAGDVTITRQETARVNKGCTEVVPVASLVRNGRLYVASCDGLLASSAHGNAMSTTAVERVSGAEVMALAPVSRPLYSGGFGRYAVYLFTCEGIYAVAQSAMGALGEARLVDRTVIARGCVPVDGNRDIYFIDRHHNLCRLTGSVVTRLIPRVDACYMAWDDEHGELHVLAHDGTVLAVDSTGYYSCRTIDAEMLYDDFTHALAVTKQGEVLDLMHELDAEQVIEYTSRPVLLAHDMRGRACRVIWNVVSDGAVLSLSLLGDRGFSCHGFLVGRLRVNGAVHAPLVMPVVSPPCRSLRADVRGSAVSGTMIATTIIENCCP